MLFGILGPLVVTQRGREVVITAGRDRTVLAMLLMHAGRVVGVQELIDAVWEDNPPATARGQLQTCISRLRRVLPAGVLRTDPAGYGITVPAQDLDAHLFTQLTTQARASRGVPDEAVKLFREALALWRGPALAGLTSRSVRGLAAVLDEQRGTAFEDWIEIELTAGREREVVAELTGLVEAYPLRERLRAQLMLALLRLGRQGDALAEYRRARELLRDELGIDPGADLQELHRRILSGGGTQDPGPRPVAAPVLSLPRTVGDFTGRQDAITRLLQAAQRTSVLTIDGMAGSGKTTLALRVAQLLGDSYPDVQLFVDLQGHSQDAPLDPGAALLALLRQAGVDAHRIPPDLDGRAALWRSELAGRPHAGDPGQRRLQRPGRAAATRLPGQPHAGDQPAPAARDRRRAPGIAARAAGPRGNHAALPDRRRAGVRRARSLPRTHPPVRPPAAGHPAGRFPPGSPSSVGGQ